MTDPTDMTQTIIALAARSADRVELWRDFIHEQQVRSLVEIGVFRGAFAAAILDVCPDVADYYMVDPWRHLEDWNKPANAADDRFERIYAEAMAVTEAHAARRRVLRGRTTEVINQIPDRSLDVAYVDGDHTLRGIAIDLIRVEPKIRPGGWIGGDDLSPSIWQHGDEYEPSMVFPFAVHFAEAHGFRFFALPHRQFLMHTAPAGFEYHDLTGNYPTTELLEQILNPRQKAGRGPVRSGQRQGRGTMEM